MWFDFTNPLALLLLLLIPLFLWLGQRSSVYLIRPRRRVFLGIRLIIIACIVLSLAGLRVVRTQNKLAVVFLLDSSDSISPLTRQQAQQWVSAALDHSSLHDRSAVVVFGENALVELPMGNWKTLEGIASRPNTGFTDIAGAMRLGTGLFPQQSAKRIILLSDGNENIGDASREALLAAASGIQVDVLPVTGNTGPEVLIDSVTTPSLTHQNQVFDVKVNVISNQDTSAKLRIFADGKLISDQQVTLEKGRNTYVISQKVLTKGFHAYQAEIDAPRDTFLQNNAASSFTIVTGKPQVLIIEGTPGDGKYLAAALQASGIDYQIRPPSGLPPDAPSLRNFDSVILANVPATSLSPEQMEATKAYVQSLGGGLLMVGGDQSYGIGGYTKTPIEEALPVSMEIKKKNKIPSVAVVLLIESLESQQNVNISKEAGKAVIDLLTPQDEVAVSGTPFLFNNSSPIWAIPLQRVTDKKKLKSEIDDLTPEDPSSYALYLQQAHQLLLTSNAKIKHIILLGDGDAHDDYQNIVKSIAADKITVSTVATGSFGADAGVMQDISTWGKGRFYQADDPSAIPQIFLKETKAVARPGIVEETFQPAIVDSSSALIRGLSQSNLPVLKGYVATTPKDTAQVVLKSSQDDPILAQWQYGLGRSVAWTSDAQNRWGTQWVQSPTWQKFVAQMVSWTFPSRIDENVQTNVSIQGRQAHITVDALQSGKFANFLSTTATIVTPERQSLTTKLVQTAPGRYEGDFTAETPGAYVLNISQKDEKGATTTSLGGLVVPYSPEYRDLGRINTPLFQFLTQQTGGHLLDPTHPERAFLHDQRSSPQPEDLWPWLLALALLLFPVDVGLRRLRLGIADVHKGMNYIQERWRTVLPARPTKAPSEVPVNPLLAVKDKAARRHFGRPAVRLISNSAPAPFSTIALADREPLVSAVASNKPTPTSASPATEPNKSAPLSSVPKLDSPQPSSAGEPLILRSNVPPPSPSTPAPVPRPEQIIPANMSQSAPPLEKGKEQPKSPEPDAGGMGARLLASKKRATERKKNE